MPSHILFTNQQLAHIVKGRPQTRTDPLNIDGVGQARIAKYADDILAIAGISAVAAETETVGFAESQS